MIALLRTYFTLSGKRSLTSLMAFAIVASVLTNCVKDVDTPAFPLVPALVLNGQSATQLTAFADTLVLSLSYTDGDGNLGGFDGTSKLFVKDQRLSEADEFSLERLTEDGEELSIEGTLRLLVGPYFVLGNAPSETFELEIWLTDRAGNESNRISTEPITVSQ